MMRMIVTPVAALLAGAGVSAAEKPNVIVYFADDISAREFPMYESSVWTDPLKEDTSEEKYRAKTPVMNRLAEEGCFVRHAWAATVCSPSRAMMMTGRYAHLHKWWHNGDKGEYVDESGKRVTWPLYESSPLQMGHLARSAGYGTYWAGKTQMAGDLMKFGFDEGCFTPGTLADRDNPHTDFKLELRKVDGEKVMTNVDTGEPADTYLQHGWYWYPHVRLMNDPSAPGKIGWWPNSEESEKAFGLHTYGPDVELDFAFKFMERKQDEGKPFFIYHTTHLGHAGFDWLHPENGQCWTGTPVVKWDGGKYIRTEPKVTGDNGKYETYGTVAETGIHSHINYIDYQVWRYLEKLKEMKLADNTILIIAADNGTGGYGKGSPDRQKGTHVPFIVYAPGFDTVRRGGQDILLNLSDVLPTLAGLMGAEIPADYEINGTSFWPWLTGRREAHREWVYGYKSEMQLIRGMKVMRDGLGKWWDVSKTPADLIGFPEIKDWKAVSREHRKERKKLMEVLPKYDLHATAHDAPGVPPGPKKEKKGRKARKPGQKKKQNPAKAAK